MKMGWSVRCRAAMRKVGQSGAPVFKRSNNPWGLLAAAPWHLGYCCGSVTKPILRTPARCAAAMAWATRS